ncbi:Conjugal transfer coupling protein TraG [Rhodovulum sp. P5]|uniref:type IV secretory system conjugative DNA transfer family protein n=1 Tax=Rhodovulum sp. P5 TaxID=1564506 RepID=UPI0009C3B95F|nr:type IV secretory system conjugative DNA transfer family protein [Rhodovulum sp. P5]ARE41700.1 Conjugal transfer coupling protein TraG [Rhodovulum sp. P5]
MSFAHDNPFGSARFATTLEILRAFRKRGGVPAGFYRGRKLYHSKQAGMLLIGGAGSGKFTTMLSHIIGAPGRNGEAPRYAIFDPKRELRAVLEPYFASIGAAVYEFNPFGVHAVTGQTLSLFSHLVPTAPTLVADSRRTARTVLPESGGGEARFFEHKAQNWLDPLKRGLVHADGGVSPTSLFELVGMIHAAPEAWAEMSESMAALGEPDLRVAFAEMNELAEKSRRTFDSVMSEITNALAFMADPLLQAALVNTAQADFTLDVLCEDSMRPVFVFFVIPPEMTEQCAGLIRAFFSGLRTYKQRKPRAPTVNLVIDEAAQLGRFPEISEFYSVGRGFGLSPLCVYQDIGQIRKNLGPTGVMTLSASADVEIYLGGGISDLETAQHLSAKLGNQTLGVADTLTQERAARAKREAIHAALFGGTDPVRTGLAMRALDYERGHIRKQARALLTADEVLAMPHNKALVLASGYGLRPFLADKEPYYTRRDYAGLYGPNPYFDRDQESVRVRARLGYRRRCVIREPVPDAYRDLPQYKNGEWQWIEGYRPKLK